MAVKLRMTRMGRRHRPFFRINAVDSRCPRDGNILEKLGHYDPIEKDKDKQIVLDLERVKYWLGEGAIPSDTVSDILLAKGLKHKYAEQRAVKRAKAIAQAKAKGKPFDNAQRAALEKAKTAAEEKIKAEAEAKAKAEADAKAKADAEAAEKAAAEQAAAEVTEEAAVEQAEQQAAEEKPAEEDTKE